ncbi:hypothetical protein DIURU_005632 [Diutina rugosa]|uniref:Flo11 domain-containing protein n=1 Tax=Diutina rugosa TaxID=5481 RepID=A0A642UEW0_DIURU|nr:uncharacterized protein DIURU_005632 [Diutina rugosa]KAA8896620.1 hypothetical protein DIURU_005632 [Diutina rugosa]
MQLLLRFLLLSSAVQSAVVKLTRTRLHTATVDPTWHTNVVVDYTTVTEIEYTTTIVTTVFGAPTTYVAATTTTVPIVTQSTQKAVDTDIVTNVEDNLLLAAPTEGDNTVTTSAAPEVAPQTQTTSAIPDTTQPVSSAVPQTTSSSEDQQIPSQTTGYVIDYTLDDSVGPTFTSELPSSTGQWLIESVSTYTSDGFCVVSYDYYESDETDWITSTRTVYVTSTAA